MNNANCPRTAATFWAGLWGHGTREGHRTNPAAEGITSSAKHGPANADLSGRIEPKAALNTPMDVEMKIMETPGGVGGQHVLVAQTACASPVPPFDSSIVPHAG
jgi:hypothetical protein